MKVVSGRNNLDLLLCCRWRSQFSKEHKNFYRNIANAKTAWHWTATEGEFRTNAQNRSYPVSSRRVWIDPMSSGTHLPFISAFSRDISRELAKMEERILFNTHENTSRYYFNRDTLYSIADNSKEYLWNYRSMVRAPKKCCENTTVHDCHIL